MSLLFILENPSHHAKYPVPDLISDLGRRCQTKDLPAYRFDSWGPAVKQDIDSSIWKVGKEGGKCNFLLFDDKWLASLHVH